MKKLLLALFVLVNAATFHAVAADADDLAYFQQFISEETLDDRDPENPIVSSRYLMSDYQAKTPLPNGDELGIIAHIILLKDFTFKLSYKEATYPKGKEGQFWPGTCKVIEGTWSVKNGQLELPGFGFLERAMWNGQMAVQMTVTELIASPEGKGFKSVAAFGFSNMPLDKAVRCFPF